MTDQPIPNVDAVRGDEPRLPPRTGRHTAWTRPKTVHARALKQPCQDCNDLIAAHLAGVPGYERSPSAPMTIRYVLDKGLGTEREVCREHKALRENL